MHLCIRNVISFVYWANAHSRLWLCRCGCGCEWRCGCGACGSLMRLCRHYKQKADLQSLTWKIRWEELRERAFRRGADRSMRLTSTPNCNTNAVRIRSSFEYLQINLHTYIQVYLRRCCKLHLHTPSRLSLSLSLSVCVCVCELWALDSISISCTPFDVLIGSNERICRWCFLLLWLFGYVGRRRFIWCCPGD